MLKNIEGQTIPSTQFAARQNDEWVQLTTDELFKDKTVIVFSLPGAFTPTCSSTHLPRFNELAPIFKQNGVDDILCVSVNDTFVMNAWAENQQAENIQLIPDGNGDFTGGMGMLVDKSAIGFGKRSWRYSMLVKNAVIEKMFIEPEVEGDPFEVSDADTMLSYINPDFKVAQDISLFTKSDCPFCHKAKALLTEQGMQFEEIVLGKDASMASLRAITGKDTVPQVFIAGQHIGGSEALESFLTQ